MSVTKVDVQNEQRAHSVTRQKLDAEVKAHEATKADLASLKSAEFAAPAPRVIVPSKADAVKIAELTAQIDKLKRELAAK